MASHASATATTRPSRVQAPPIQQHYRVRALAEANDLAPSTIYSWIAAGDLEAIKVRGVVLIPAAAWESFLARHRA